LSPLRLDEFASFLASLARFETPPFLAVAVSGGPDSLALAILADRWARARGGEICALTVDHRLRPEGPGEIRQLRDWLSARAIRHEVLVWSGDRPRSGIQEAARIARYRLLAGWCRDNGCLHLLTAHHRDDQIETHLIRRRAHSGADGLAGMSAIRELADCRVLRPLLGVAKDRLRAFLAAEGQPFITDPSNLNPAYERSRFRVGGEATRDGAAASDLLAEIRNTGSKRAERERDGNGLCACCVDLHPAGFAVLEPSILRGTAQLRTERLLAAVAVTIGGAFYPPRRERMARLCEALRAAKRGYTLAGCRFVRWGERVLVLRELALAAPPIRPEPSKSVIWDRRFKVTTPSTANGRLTIAYLGLAGVAQLNRVAPQLRRSRVPRLLFPIFPAMWDDNGIMAVPHLGYRRKGVGTLPRVIFQPVNPLAPAGFAVV
jgi:tRNA(Ile)-lysidine synthase